MLGKLFYSYVEKIFNYFNLEKDLYEQKYFDSTFRRLLEYIIICLGSLYNLYAICTYKFRNVKFRRLWTYFTRQYSIYFY